MQKLSARTVVYDIRSGMSNEEMAAKYNLTRNRLAAILTKLIDARLVAPQEVSERISALEESSGIHRKKPDPVCYPIVRVTIHDLDDIEAEGWVRDVSRNVVEVSGLDSVVGSTKVFLVKPPELEGFEDLSPFSFDAECTGVIEDESGAIARYGITSILDEDRRELDKLVESAMFCE